MIYYTKEDTELPFLVVKNDRIIGVNDAFLELSSYNFTEVLNKPFYDFWRFVLRISASYRSAIKEAFMFTKDFEARCISVQPQESTISNETTYWFNEFPNSRFQNRNQFISKLISEDIVGIAVYSVPDFILMKANLTYLSYFPEPYHSKEASYGKSLKEIIPEFHGSKEEQRWIEVIEKQHSLYIKEQHNLILKNRDLYWNNTLTPIVENGKVKYIVSVLEDVTDFVLNRLQVTEQSNTIRKQKEELDTIIDNISEGIAIFDKNGNYIKTNKKVGEYGLLLSKLGSNVEKVGDTLLEGKEYYDINDTLLQFDDLPIVKVLKSKKAIHQIFVKKYNDKLQYYECNGNPILDMQGNVELGVLSIKNITDRYEQEKLIKEQKEQLELILNNMSDAVFIVDKNGYIILKNIEAQKKLFSDNTEHSLIYDPHYSECFDMDGNKLNIDMLPSMRALKGEKAVATKLRIKNPKLEWLADVIANPIYDDKGVISMVVVCLRDITQQAQVELEKREGLEEALSVKDEFLYLITHDFKTPIAVINSALQAIELVCKGEISGKLGKFLDTIRQNTNRQLRLVNNLLDITRITSGHAKQHEKSVDIVYITRAIVNSVDLYVQQKNIKLSFSTEISEKVIWLDDEKYERILLNLLSNALKFTPSGKSIYVELSLKKYKNKNMVCLQVRDEGIGIEKEKQAHVFERFGQVESSLSRQAEGTGLGLHLVKLLVNAIKGTITLESEVGKGSTFTILIPTQKLKATDFIEKQGRLEDSFAISDSRFVAATAIEFSDIYF